MSKAKEYLDKLQCKAINFLDIKGATVAKELNGSGVPCYILDSNCAIEVFPDFAKVTNVINNQYVETIHFIH